MMSFPGIAANSLGRSERIFRPLGCKLLHVSETTKAQTWQADKQEAEASVCELLGSLVNDGLESEPFKEYGKRWTGHTAAYDDDFGHMRFQVTRTRGSQFRGRRGRVSEVFF